MNFRELEVLLLTGARSPEAVFPGVSDVDGIGKASRKLAAIVHPDVNPQNATDAAEAFRRLTTWTDRAVEKMKAGNWGDGKPYPEFSFAVAKVGQFNVFGLHRREALFDSFDVERGGTPLLLHIPRKPRYEPLAVNAARALRAMGGQGVPSLVLNLRLNSRLSYVTSRLPSNIIPLSSLMEDNPDGVPVGRMLRLAMALMPVIQLAHKSLLVHGSINPLTWMVHEVGNHSYLTDWHYSTLFGNAVEYVNETYDCYCPWEVIEREPANRGTDLATVMKVVQLAIGQQDTPKTLDHLIAAHLREGPSRPTCPATCYKRLKAIADKL